VPLGGVLHREDKVQLWAIGAAPSVRYRTVRPDWCRLIEVRLVKDARAIAKRVLDGRKIVYNLVQQVGQHRLL
jgi:hypothetical protein